MAPEAHLSQADIPSALPAGTRVGEFELLSVLGVGGFGIVYLAFDHALEREVAVKEYMPASLAGRTETLQVSLRSQSDADTFALGLKSFVNEARLLARFDHPSLLKVHRFWEANGTAYMAMPVMRGRTLKDLRLGFSEPPSEAWLRSLLEPLLGAIERLHSEGVYHRDIAPDNIQLDAQGRPVLLDFGAARRVLSDKTHTLTAILKPAYAPIEQYAEAGAVRQGPWTDLYSLGATLYYLLLGHPPAPATARTVHDEPSALTVDRLGACSENFLRLVDWMLEPRPADRPQSVAQVQEALAGQRLAPRRGPPPAAVPWERTSVLPAPMMGTTRVAQADIPLEVADERTLWMPSPAAAPVTGEGALAASPSVGAVAGAGAGAGAADGAPEVAEAPAPPPVPWPERLPEPTLPRAAPGTAPESFAADPDRAAGAAAHQAAQGASAPAARRRSAIGLGVGALLVALAALAFWPRPPAADGGPALPEPSSLAPLVGPGAPAEAAPAAPVDAAVPAGPAAVAPGTHDRPESAITTVVVQPGAQARPAGAAMRNEPGPQPAARPAPAGSGSGTVAGAPRAAPTEAAAPPQAVPAAQARPPAGSAPGEPASPAPAPVNAQAAPAPALVIAPAAGAGPQASCAGRNVLSHFVCMETACLKSANQAHPDCLAWRKDAKRD